MEPLIVLIGGGLVMLLFGIWAYVAGIIQDKLNAWLTDRKLKKKFGDKWNQ